MKITRNQLRKIISEAISATNGTLDSVLAQAATGWAPYRAKPTRQYPPFTHYVTGFEFDNRSNDGYEERANLSDLLDAAGIEHAYRWINDENAPGNKFFVKQ